MDKIQKRTQKELDEYKVKVPSPMSDDDILANYTFRSVLGTGTHAIVLDVDSEHDSKDYAMKIQCKSKASILELKIHLAIAAFLTSSHLLAHFVAIHDYGIATEEQVDNFLDTNPEERVKIEDELELVQCKTLVLVVDRIDKTLTKKLFSKSPFQIAFELYYGILSLLSYNIIPRDIGLDNIGVLTHKTSTYRICDLTVVTRPYHIKFIDYGMYEPDIKMVDVESIKHEDVMRVLHRTFSKLKFEEFDKFKGSALDALLEFTKAHLSAFDTSSSARSSVVYEITNCTKS